MHKTRKKLRTQISDKIEKVHFWDILQALQPKEGTLRWFGPIVQNDMLPENLKTLSTLDESKTEVKKWVPENCPCQLCKEYLRGIGFVDLFD